MSILKQKSLKKTISLSGVGLHSGKKVNIKLVPQSPNTGIYFKRTDLKNNNIIYPSVFNVSSALYCTKISNEYGVSVSTVEHLMAALYGKGIDNLLIEIDSEEVPILDGSAVTFVKEILKTGIKIQKCSLKAVRILKTVKYKKDTAWAKFEPSNYPRMSFSIEFSEEVIGAQSKTLDMSNGSFVRELCDSRTFCRHSEVEAMRSKGLALGGSFDNAVVVDGKDVLSPGGLRYSDEPVRHKMLDALGDIALAGYPILGHYIGHRAGHGITHGLLKSLFSDSENFEIISCDQDIVDTLPGSGVQLSEVCKVD